MNARLLFGSAALFNWAATLLFLPVLGLATRLGLAPAPTGTIFEYIALWAIFAFGLGYWMVGRAPAKWRSVAVLGMASKFGVVAIVVGHYLAGSVNLPFALVVGGDVLYAILFAIYLQSTRKDQA
ncbi:MAG: hypothetical protein V4463_09395 [Pseudomonadota bacterium]